MSSRAHSTRVLDADRAQQTKYDALVEFIMSKQINPFDPRDAGIHLAWLSLYASATGRLDERKAILLGQPSSKTNPFFETFSSTDDGTPTVVFAQSLQLLDILRTSATKKKSGWAEVTAVETNSTRTRGRGVAEFSSGQKRVLLTTMHRDIGTSFPRARRALFLQRPWHPGAISWIEDSLPLECEIIHCATDQTVDRLWPYTLDQLAEMATSPDVVHDLMKGRMPHGEQEDSGPQNGSKGNRTRRAGPRALPTKKNRDAGLAR